MPIHAPKIGVLGVKVGGNGNFCSFIRLGMQSPGTNALRIKQRKNRLCGFGSRHEQKFGHKKNKRESDISPICTDDLNGAINMSFGV